MSSKVYALVTLFYPNEKIAENNMLGFIYLFLQVYETPEYYETIIKSFIFSAKIVVYMSVIVWLICMIFPVIGNAISLYFELQDSGNAAFIFMIVKRQIWGFEFLRVYYCTAPCMICALGYYLLKQFNKKSKKNFFYIILFSFGLLISGARANILVVALLLGAYICLKLVQKKKLATAFFIIMIVSFASLLFLILMVSEKTDSSIKVKTLHKLSYNKIFEEHPFKMLFTGWGAGSEFYSRGFHKMTDTTELSLYETIRRYGLISTILIFIFIWGRPIIFCWSNKMSLIYRVFFSIILISYIAVACTNPFLLGSIGFCSLIFMETLIYYYYDKSRQISIREI